MKHLRNFILLLMFVSAATVYAAKKVSPPVKDHTDAVAKITLTVKVVNATASGTKVEGDKAFAFVYHHGQQLAVLEETVGSDGLAVFKDVAVGDHFQVVARVKHSDMMFGARPVNMDSSGDAVNTEVEVYDVSFDNSLLRIGSHDINVKISGKSLLVTEYMQLMNPTDTAVSSSNMEISNKPKVIEISLPAGFSELKCIQYFVESALVVTEDGFYDTMAIPPGSFKAAFTYKIDLDDGKFWNFQKKITLPTNDLQVFSQLDGGVLEGLGDIAGTSNAPDGTAAQKYAASSYMAGDKLVLQISVGQAASSGNKTTVIIIVCVIGVVVLLLVFSRKRLKS